MGRKSSAKAQTREQPPAAPPPDSRQRFPIWLVAVIAIIGIAAGAVYLRSDNGAASQTAQTREPEPVPAVNQTPHPQAALPPLPFIPTPPARPMDVVREVYKFSAEHPEVLSYVPCYCGCEHSGHRGNEDCFVTARAANGDVTEWEPHGMT